MVEIYRAAIRVLLLGTEKCGRWNVFLSLARIWREGCNWTFRKKTLGGCWRIQIGQSEYASENDVRGSAKWLVLLLRRIVFYRAVLEGSKKICSLRGRSNLELMRTTY